MFHTRRVAKQNKWVCALSPMLAVLLGLGPCLPAFADKGGGHGTATPIQHLIIIVGENRTFDSVFGGYQPRHGQSVMNLLSQGIINGDGTPGPNFGKAAQWQASDTSTYSINPGKTGQFSTLPQPNTTSAFGQPQNVPDARFPGNLPNGPFQISKYTAYQGAFTGDPVHRFFQMWQDYDEGKMDLFAWVGVTIGTGSNGNPQPSPFTEQTTNQGGVAMGFFNMSEGDAPVFKFIADNYAISDNYHQAIMGGTGANFIFLGTADEGFFTDADGNPATPPANQIENPNPQPGTNNWYTQDGYSGGSYVNCADSSQPGVSPIRDYLASLGVNPNCDSGHYYLVNNYGPAYQANGQPVDTSTHPFTLPPQNLPNLAQSLTDAGVSWKYYIGGYNGGDANDSWCSICNPFQFIKSVVTNPALHRNFADVPDFYKDLARGDLPAVSWIRPYEIYAGHPADSGLFANEDFVASIANAVIKDRKLFNNTAILVTFDEGGGYYDSGYIQPVDFFGDGTRIPLMVISPYVRAGTIDHTYYDHGSIVKFIEKNWGVGTLSARSRDNLPNPVASGGNPYVPINGPAIGDLMNLFDFDHKRNVNEAPLIIPGGI
jgi:acid phosphatase